MYGPRRTYNMYYVEVRRVQIVERLFAINDRINNGACHTRIARRSEDNPTWVYIRYK